MAFNINAFQQHLQQYGYSSANKFDVYINQPNIFSTSALGSNMSQILQFRADNVFVPQIQLLYNETNRYGSGPLVKEPYSAVFGNISASFITDKSGLIYSYFFNWINAVYNFAETYSSSGTNNLSINGTNQNFQSATYTSQYEDDVCASSIDFNFYDNTGALIQTTTAFRAKPVLLTTAPLSWDQTNTLLKITVAFVYKEWSLLLPSTSTNAVPSPSQTLPETGVLLA